MPIQSLELRRLLAGPDIDLTFGEGGLAPLPGFRGEWYAVNELPDGRIVVAGEGGRPVPAPGVYYSPLVARFNPDGTLDTTFDGDGILDPPPADAAGTADVTVAPDGKLLAVLNTDDNAGVRFARYNADGTVDTSFGTGGVVTHALADYRPLSVQVQGDGKIVFTFTQRIRPSVDEPQTYVARLNADGSIDTSYRGGLASPQPVGINGFEDSIVGPDGKLYITGERFPEDLPALEAGAVARLNIDGTIDTTFGGTGIVELLDRPAEPNGAPEARLTSVTVDPAGRVLVAAQYFTSNPQGAIVTRLRQTGARDTTFGEDGHVRIDIDDAGSASDVLVGPDGHITGAITQFNTSGVTFYRIEDNGTLDADYGNGGVFTPDRQVLQPRVLKLDTDGNLLFAGRVLSDDGFSAIAVGRLVDDSPEVFANSAGHLFVAGTRDADTIALALAGDEIVVTRNGVRTSVPRAGVELFIPFPGSGNDAITVPFELDCSIKAGAGDDALTLGDGDMNIDGEDGDDVIFCGDGAHVINLGSGNNRLTLGAGSDSVRAFGEGNDIITTSAGDDTIIAGGGDDSITTGTGDDYVETGHGDDTVHSGAGDDRIQDVPNSTGGDVDNFPGEASGNKQYFGGDGADTLIGSRDADTLMGGADKDSIGNSRGPDFISGDGGSDRIYLFEFSETPSTVRGGTGNDRILSFVPHLLFGDRGDDTILGGDGGSTIRGGEGNDSIKTGNGSDVIYADAGSDTIKAGAGSDRINGGAGKDRVFGQQGNDRIDGGSNDDAIDGGPGSDVIRGQGGNDKIFGGPGNDRLDAGTDDDFIAAADNAVDTLFAGGGRDRATVDAALDLIDGLEIIL